MKYFLDTEFHERRLTCGNDTIELISIGIVAEDGRELYMLSSEIDLYAATENEWLLENVLMPIFREHRTPEIPYSYGELIDVFKSAGCSRKVIADTILEFVGDDAAPQFYGYYADYDWVVFCWLFGRMIDLPLHFPMYCRDLKQMLDDLAQWRYNSPEALKKHPAYPKQENEHHALADARWNKALYEFLSQR